MFSNVTIKRKLTLGIGILVLLSAIMAAFGIFGRNYQNKLHRAMATTLSHENAISLVASSGAETYRVIADAIINRDLTDAKGRWNDRKEKNQVLFKSIDTILDSENKKELFSKSQDAYKNVVQLVENEVFPLLERNGDILNIRSLDGKIDKAIDEIVDPLHQIVSIKKSENAKQMKQFKSSSQIIVFITLIVFIVIAVVSVLVQVVLTKGIVVPINSVVAMLKDISQGEGDLTKEITLDSNDEIGELAEYFNIFVDKIRSIIREVASNTSQITSSTMDLSAISEKISEGGDVLVNQSSTVAAATEQATTNINNISTSAEEMSTSVTTVATAIEEMSASLNEVSRNCQKELEIANQANQQTKSTQSIMENLGSAAQEIGKIVDLINDIADQTNLLALNATIEAASAGEAGKGFAVVATEVKELAKQTAQATQNIIVQIEGMQKNTTNAVNAIELIAQIIEEVNSISQTIVSAIEEQSATVNEVSRSIGGASGAATEIARNVSESARGLSEVARNIATVNTTVSDTTEGIQQIKNNTVNVSSLSTSLDNLVKQFKY